MHRIEDILVHSADIKVGALAHSLHLVNKGSKGHIKLGYIDDHYHREVFLEHALRDLNDIRACLGALCADLGDYSLAVVSDYGNYCIHKVYHPWI